LVDSIQSVEA
jgi:hypothetical protein